jgi:hypothetical protein
VGSSYDLSGDLKAVGTFFVGPGLAFARDIGLQVSSLFSAEASLTASYLKLTELGINYTARVRYLDREMQSSSTDRRTRDYCPVLLDPGQTVQLIHAAPAAASAATWEWARKNLSWYGIDLAALDDATDYVGAKDWRTWVQLQATPASVGDLRTNYYRTQTGPAEAARDAQAALDWALRKGGVSRAADREVILSPWASWGPDEAARLKWMGVATDDQYYDVLRAAGYVRPQDVTWARQLALQLPAPEELLRWEARRLWDEQLAGRYGLDTPGASGTLADFLARAQGMGATPTQLPDQPAGNADWRQLTYRNARPVPGFGEALQMQWRLRPSVDNPAESVVPGVPPWTAVNTRDALTMQGFSPECVNWLMGLSVEPINIRIINHVLTETLKHPELLEKATRVFGVGTDWVKEAFLNHGFAPTVAELTADALRAVANDQYYAERLGELKRLRADRRKAVLDNYLVGTTDRDGAIRGMQDEFFDADMAGREIEIADQTIARGIVDRQIKAVRETFMRGNITAPAAYGALVNLGITVPRANQYVLEWRWDRTEAVRSLQTGEILSLLKNGLLSPQAALLRLGNLGWNSPDALLEVTLVEKELAAAAQHAAAIAAAKSAAESARTLAAQQRQAAKDDAAAARLETAEAKAAAAAEAKADKELAAADKAEQAALAKATTAEERQAAHEAAAQARADAQAAKLAAAEAVAAARLKDKEAFADALAVHQRLLARDRYYAAVHLANKAYADAEKKGDHEKMDAEIARELADYQAYITEQIKIRHGESPGEQAISPIDEQTAPGTGASAQAVGDAVSPLPPDATPAPKGKPGHASGGTGSATPGG